MELKTLPRIAVLLAAAGLFATSAGAASVAILNPSFEADNIANDGILNAPGLNWLGSAGALDRNPSGSNMFDVRIQPTPDPTDSEQLAWSNGGAPRYQVLSTNVAPNTVYTLTVDVGDRTDTNFGGGSIRLGVGGTAGANLLTPDSVVNPTPTSNWVLWQTVYTTGASPTPGALRVELVGGGVQTLFDNVRLDATPIPEPGATALLAFGLLGLLRRRR